MVRSKKESMSLSGRTKLGGGRCGGELGDDDRGGVSDESCWR